MGAVLELWAILGKPPPKTLIPKIGVFTINFLTNPNYPQK
jgi:hypothetical protein